MSLEPLIWLVFVGGPACLLLGILAQCALDWWFNER